MFGKLKDKLKNTLSIFSKKTEEEAEEKIEEQPVEEPQVEEKKVEEPTEVKEKEPEVEEQQVEEKKVEEPETPTEEVEEKVEVKEEPKETIEGVKITYFVHGTTTDNEDHKATGWNPGELSELGITQAKELGEKVKEKNFEVVFCSDLKRAIDSAELGFKDKYEIIQDKRIRECNYGDWNSKPKDWKIINFITKKYPSGESYKQVEVRIAKFLNDLYDKYQGKHIAIVAHQAPQLALDVLLKNKNWEEAINEDWRTKKDWQPGWEYELKNKIKISELSEQPEEKEIPSSESLIEATKEKFAVEELPKEERERIKEAERQPTAEELLEEVKEGPEKEPIQEEPKKGLFGKLKQSFTTKTISADKFDDLFWDLELILLESNVSIEVIEKIKEDLKEELVNKPLPRDVHKKIEETLKSTLNEILSFEKVNLIEKIKQKEGPFVITFFGINGTGKTTSIAKLTNYLKENNLSVVLAACDTFRAAAIDQLQEHADKLEVKMIKHDYGSDAAAVAFDAKKYAEKNHVDVVLIDTAGRLHSNTNLMAELEKIIRVTQPDFKVFVGESITGNDCIEQAKKFNELVEMDGAILTKADIDEKGGAPLSISYTIKKPILFLGMGQEYKDFEPFDKELILKRLGF
ncbi:signal recognition particle-docking protein FtsY [Candidatus Woesearchaeota archaeon]|nr:signal recognition particle-docking protein FtsY [Candidatus Woesearchaeota archaeon]